MKRVSPFPTLSRHALATLLALGAAAAGAQAQPVDDDDPDGGGSYWGLGLAAGYEREPYRDFDNKVQALPLIVYENRWISLFGPRLDLKLPASGPLSFKLRVAYKGEGYEADDSPFLAGMAERKGGFWTGAAVTWETEAVELSAEWLADVSGNSKGQRLKLVAERDFQYGKFRLTPRVGGEFFDKKYVDYYYGVRADEALAGRPAYQGKATWAAEVGLRVGYGFTPAQTVFVDVSGKRYGSQIDDSPLVERPASGAVRLGYLYRF